MKRLVAILLFCAGLYAPVCAAKDAAESTVPALRVEGTALTATGRPVVLQGVSYGWHNLWPRFYNARSVRTFAREWNVNVVRAAMGVDLPDGWLEKPRRSETCVRRIVDAAVSEGVYVIIDWHCHRLLAAEAVGFFARMAHRYCGVNNVIYEICNEPDDNCTWDEVRSYSEIVVRAIRAVDPQALILIGSPHWDQDVHLAADNPLEGFSNIMYTLHFYAATHRQELRDRADYALSKGLPLFVSECAGVGATGDGPIDRAEWALWRRWMAGRGIGWAVWAVGDKTETSALFRPEASSEGPWAEDALTEWGVLVYSELHN